MQSCSYVNEGNKETLMKDSSSKGDKASPYSETHANKTHWFLNDLPSYFWSSSPPRPSPPQDYHLPLPAAWHPIQMLSTPSSSSLPSDPAPVTSLQASCTSPLRQSPGALHLQSQALPLPMPAETQSGTPDPMSSPWSPRQWKRSEPHRGRPPAC